MGTAEAGRQLGISVRQVQRLASTGVLTRVGTFGRGMRIDARSDAVRPTGDLDVLLHIESSAAVVSRADRAIA